MVLMRPFLLSLLLGVLLGATPPPQDAYLAAVDAWHSDRVARLGASDGWLSLVGRDWLTPGENSLGSAPGSTVLLPVAVAPAKAGLFLLEGGSVRLQPLPGSGLLLNGKPATAAILRADADGQPDILQVGRVRLHLIRRGSRFAIRLKDPETPALKAFHGVPRYPVDPVWRVEAEFTAYPSPQVRAIPTVLGTTEPMKAPGLLRFRVAGREVTLEPMLEEGDQPELFLIFKDATSGQGTYGAGRFLYADLPKNGKVILDFNRAINPPCAFTIFATCPLPPKQNQLTIAIPAGEKDPGMH